MEDPKEEPKEEQAKEEQAKEEHAKEEGHGNAPPTDIDIDLAEPTEW
jgi:hypothetical protein